MISDLTNLVNVEIDHSYTILSELGRGNNGVVFLARQTSLGRIVALKILLPSLSDNEAFTNAFITEAQISAQLDHENIIQAIGGGYDHQLKLHYFAMEYIDGISLETIRIEYPDKLDFLPVMNWMTQLARALHYAWEHLQMIHGDIKPENVMIRRSDAVLKLADLGLAKIIGQSEHNIIMATPMYAAPEVIDGNVAKIGVKSDIYSFGVMCYELFAGAPPFDGETTDAILEQHLNQTPMMLADVKKSFDILLSDYIDRMMNKDPMLRPDSWGEVVEFFTAALYRLKCKQEQDDVGMFAPLKSLALFKLK